MFCPRCHRPYDQPGLRFCPEDGAPLTTGARSAFLRARPTRQAGAILDGRYEVKGFVGKGGMARVYLAEDVKTKQPVAVKIMNRDVAKNAVARERFLREVEVAATIGHPNVVQVLDAGERPDGSPFIVLEFLHGESLGDLLRRDGSVEPAFGLPMLCKAAAALDAAHRAGIVHRDVKPDNLFLLGERGAPYTLKVVDFGMAKLQEGSHLSQTGMTVGTIAYIAPEQALADPIDGRTDVYGLGVVMYRTLTGKLPFEARDDATLLAMHLFLPPPPPTSVRPGLDPRIEAVILTALRKRPENRYPTMAALLADLERISQPDAPPSAGVDQPDGPRGGDVVLAPLSVLPDIYEPVTQTAREAAAFLRQLVLK